MRLWLQRLGTVDFTLMELYLSLAALWWCVVLAFPFGTFSFATNASFRDLARVMPEEGWGAVAGALAVGPLVTAYKGWRPARLTFLAGHTLFRGVQTVVIARANIWSTGTGIYGLMAACAGFLTVLTAMQAGWEGSGDRGAQAG